MIVYKNIPYRFDASLWAAFCEQAVKKHGLADIAGMIAVHPNTVTAWIKQNHKGDFPHPSMNKFLNLCNLMELDPGQFFTIADDV